MRCSPCMPATSAAAFAVSMPAAVTSSGRWLWPRSTGVDHVSFRKALLATPITGTADPKLLEQTRSQPRLVRAEPDVAVYDIGIGLNPQPLDHGQQQRQLPLVEAARLIVLRRAGHVLGHLRRWSRGCPGLGQHAANACRVMQISDVEDGNRRTHSYRSMHGFAPS